MRIRKETITQQDIENIVDYVRNRLTRAAVAGAAVEFTAVEATYPVEATAEGVTIQLGWENYGTDIDIKIGGTGFKEN